MAVRVNILTTYNGAGNKKAMRDLALMQKQATLAGNGMAAGMFKASAGMQRAGASMAKTGAFMSRNITLPVAAIGAVSVVMAAKFEDSMKLIQTQAGGSANDVKVLSAAVLELGAKGQHGPNELAGALYHLKSVGMDNAQAMKALTQSERLASVGHADLEATTNAVAGAYKSGIKGAQNFGVTVGTLNAIIGAGNLRMDDLNSALGTGFLVTAKTFGVSLTSVGAALAMMTSRGIPATRAAMALKMAFSGIAAPSDKAQKYMTKLHLSSKKLAETMRSGGMLPALQMLKDKLAGLTKTEQSIALTKMFGAKSSQAILTLLGNLKDYDRTLKQVKDNTGKFNELAKAQAEDATAKWEHFKSSMGSAAILIGNQLLPTAISLADRLGAVGAWLNKLSPSTRRWVIGLGLIVGVAGPVLLIVGKMTLGIGKLIGTAGKLALAFGKGAKAAPGYARALAAVAKGLVSIVKQGVLAVASIAKQAAVWVAETAAKVAATAATIAHAVATKAAAAAQWLLNAALSANPIGLIIAAVAALVAIVVILWKKNETFRRIVTAVWEKVKSVVSALLPVLKAVGKAIFGALSAVWNKVSAAVRWFWDWAGPFITKAIGFWWASIQYNAKLIYAVVKWLWTNVSAAVNKFWKWAGPFIKTAVKVWWTQIKTTFAAIKAVTVTAWNAIKAVVQTNVKAITAVVHGIQALVAFVRGVFNAIRSVAMTVGRSIASVVGDIWSGIKTRAQSVWNAIIGVVRGAWKSIAGFVNKIIGSFNWVVSKVPGLKGKSIPRLPIGDDSRRAAAVARTAAAGAVPMGDDSRRPAGIGDFSGSVKGALSALSPLNLLDKVPWPDVPGGMFGGAASALLELVKEAVANLVKKALASIFSGGTGGGSAAVGGKGYGWAYALAKQFGLFVSSTFRPGAITAAGNISDHGTYGRAADIAGGTGAMGSLWKYVKQTAGSWKQAIYQHQMVNYGRLGYYGPSDHFDHVHLARATGGDSRSASERGGGAQVVIARGAVQVELTVGAGVRPEQVRTAARSGVEQALVRLAREINAT